MHHDLRMVSVASKDDSESAADTASDRTTIARRPACVFVCYLLQVGVRLAGALQGALPRAPEAGRQNLRL